MSDNNDDPGYIILPSGAKLITSRKLAEQLLGPDPVLVISSPSQKELERLRARRDAQQRKADGGEPTDPV